MPTTFITSFIETPIGNLTITGNEKGIASIAFTDASTEAQPTAAEPLADCIIQLEQYFAGQRTVFDSLRLRYGATDFQKSVWDSLMEVPFGQTITYGELAKLSGYEGAARAVGTAMKQNPLPIIIPCHRVVPSDGATGQYAFGAHRKKWLLRHEQG